MSTVRENIEAGKYYLKGKRAISKPVKPEGPEEWTSMQAYIFADALANYENDLLAWEEDRERVRREQARLYEEDFANDLAEENGLNRVGQLASILFRAAWDRRYLQGLAEVCEEYKHLVALYRALRAADRL